MSAGKKFVAHCQECHGEIGELSREELDFVVFNRESQLLCFSCDDGSAENTPGFFWNWDDATEFKIGDESFVLNWSASGSPQFSRARTHDTRMRACLSSTLKKSTSIDISTPIFDLQEYGECPTCKGLGWTNGNSIQFHCPTCNGDGEIVKAIYLPLWLVSGGREHA